MRIKALVGVSAAAVTLFASVSAQAGLNTLNFDEDLGIPANSPITTQYASRGITFLSGTIFQRTYSQLNFSGIDSPVKAPTSPVVLNGGVLGTSASWKSPQGAKSFFSGESVPKSNFLGLDTVLGNSKCMMGTAIKFDFPVDTVGLKVARPGAHKGGSTMYVLALFDTKLNTRVTYKAAAITAGTGWDSYSYAAPAGTTFDLVVIYGQQRLMVDDISYHALSSSTGRLEKE